MTTSPAASPTASQSAPHSGFGSSGSFSETCDACNGTGKHAHFLARSCTICGGSGQIPLDRAA